jgi:hypothetical protein
VDKDAEVLENGNQDAHEQRPVAPPDAKRRRIRELLVSDALCSASPYKVDVPGLHNNTVYIARILKLGNLISPKITDIISKPKFL